MHKRIIISGLVFMVLLFSLSPAGELIYSTYLGGSGHDEGYGIAIDAEGNAYVTGRTQSVDFPVTAGAYDTTYNTGYDIFISKLNSIGSVLLYSTRIGGSGNDESYGIALDTAGNIYITGHTSSSTDFPVTAGAIDTSYNGHVTDVFVSKIDSTGAALLYSTYLGGDEVEYSYGIAVDIAGSAYLTGYTGSTTFPVTAAAFDTISNSGDTFVTKLNADGSSLVYSTFLGTDTSASVAIEIALDNGGNAYITGYTYSPNFPVTAGAFDTSYNGNMDIFVSKLNSTGTALVYSTYLGGTAREWGHGIAVDTAGNAYVTGEVWSVNFPVTAGAFDTSFNGGNCDACVTKLNSTGSALVYSTYLGGDGVDSWGNDEGRGIAVDAYGNAYLTGYSWSSTYPTTFDSFDSIDNDVGADIVVTKLNDTGTALLYSTYLGGLSGDAGLAIAVDAIGDVYITGLTWSAETFPVSANAFDPSFNGPGGTMDAFVSKFYTEIVLDNAAYSDVNQNSLVDAGDTLTIQFTHRIRINNPIPEDFYLPILGDSLGSGATVSINTVNDTQIVITLGITPGLTRLGLFSGITTPGSPSGLDIAATMTPNAIEGLRGLDVKDHGVRGVNDTGRDIKDTMMENTTYIVAAVGGIAKIGQDFDNVCYSGHSITIPSTSLVTDSMITAGPPEGGLTSELSAVKFAPSTISFGTTLPATLTLQYTKDDARLEAGYSEYGMRIHQWKNATIGWVPIPELYGSQTVDLENRKISVKIDKLNMVGANTSIVYASISLPTVGEKTAMVAAAPGGFWQGNQFAPGTTVTITVGTTGIYTRHKLTLTNYTTTYSGITIVLKQPTQAELSEWGNFAALKIITYGTITTPASLTMEYQGL